MSTLSSEPSPPEREKRAAELVSRARELVPLLDRAGDSIEEARYLPDGVLDALHEARLFRLLIPRSCGGEEVDPVTFFKVLEVLAEGDASAAWCVNQGCGVSIAAAYLKPEVARTVFNDPRAVAASGPFTPKAKAVICEGGYRVTGAWSFASGSKHSAWLCGVSRICEPDGQPRLGPGGQPLEPVTAVFPKSAAVVTDVWDVMGLQGTASDDYAVKDLFVPADFCYTRDAYRDRREWGPLYNFSIYNLFGLGFSAVALGIARRSLSEFIKLARVKTPFGRTQRLAENNVIQSEVGLADLKLKSSRAHVIETFQTFYRAAAEGEGEGPRPELRAAQRSATCYAMHQAREVVNFVHHAAGTTAIFKGSPFERRFRDLQTLTQQGQAAFANFESLGEVLLAEDAAG